MFKQRKEAAADDNCYFSLYLLNHSQKHKSSFWDITQQFIFHSSYLPKRVAVLYTIF